MEIRPITLKAANAFVGRYHRHHKPVTGCKFAISCYDNDNLVGVAICGRPVSRILDDGVTLEVNRCCTDGTKNACSMLYGATCRTAKAMGYKRVITYTLQSEPGISLRAAGFYCDGVAGAPVWTGKRSGRNNGVPPEYKTRWIKIFGGGENADKPEGD